MQKASDLQKKYLPKLILSDPSEFESLWTEYVNEFAKLDAKSYEAFVTKVVKDRVAGKW
ncbi:hypothetical protein PACILC2_08700 [Paenibacillus cisolokensis]|uniref:Uncharacterized protein n=1 Tax=Paenibacillus cisolokensis TaxID=1658519 RepID=A0ABQ4N2D0_9BACL|nr:hypothetical protein PACILC2_08700 [Paenibacillus cisolokensis]